MISGELLFEIQQEVTPFSISTGLGTDPGTPRLLFEEQYFSQTFASNYDVSPDGQRFVMIREDELSAPTQINVVLSWFEELKRLVPAN